MAWIRLYLTVEGQTERVFADDVLRPHLAQFSVDLHTRVVVTHRKLGKRGGILSFANFASDLTRLLREHRGSDVRFSTMIDYYALPNDFPGWAESRKQASPRNRVEVLEAMLKEHFGDRRFLPHIQLHEFETLLYCDLLHLSRRISGSEKAIVKLQNEVANMPPEDINEGDITAPSKRIIRHIPQYESLKVRVGAATVAAIGLKILRSQCPHFDAWVTSLECLSEE